VFSPASSAVVVPPDVLKLSFTAQVHCSQVILNSGLEDNSGWNIPITEYPAGCSSSRARSGSRSLRTGIVDPANNTFSASSVQQKVPIPAGTASAYFTFWIKPYSGVTGGMSLPSRPAKGSALDNASLAGDAQYVLLLDSNVNTIDTLVWQLSNSRTWTQYQFNPAGYAGHSI
jgi:hypothetical protein